MINKYICVSLLLVSSLFSANINQIENDLTVLEKETDVSKNINRSKANSNEDVVELNNNSVDIPFANEPELNRPRPIDMSKELMYFSLIQKMENDRDKNSLMAVKPTKINTYALKENTAVQNNGTNPSSLNSNSSNANTKVMNFNGICQFDNTYNITQDLTVNIPCRIDNKILLLNVTLKANNSVYELNGIPNFILFDELNNGTYSKKIDIDSALSSVKNSVGNSNNIATYFDSRKIDKLLGVTARELSKSMADGTKQTFDDYRDYKKEEQLTFGKNDNIIVTTNTQKPDIATNLAYSAVEGVFRVVEKGVEMLNVESLPALYQVLKGSIINIDLYTKTNTNNTNSNIGNAK